MKLILIDDDCLVVSALKMILENGRLPCSKRTENDS